MVTVTERAGALLEPVPADQGLTEPPRIVHEADQLTRTGSPPESDDELLDHGATPVLRLAPAVAATLAGGTITTPEPPAGAEFAVMHERSPDGRAARGRP